MSDDLTRGSAGLADVEQELRRWRAAHPDATLTEIEGALDARLREARAGLLAELASNVPAIAQRCPACGDPLVRRGERTRTLRTQGDQPLALTRPYVSCAACGAGLFPPR